MCTEFLNANLKERDHFRDVDIDRKITLSHFILENQVRPVTDNELHSVQ
jgi:hypothetical protein